jgi:hypothetical protein
MLATVHVGDGAVGSVETTELPPESTATHSASDAHETPLKLSEPSMLATVHVGDVAIGSVEITALPLLSIATHNAPDAHDTPDRSLVTLNGIWLSTVPGAVHVSGEAARAGGATAPTSTQLMAARTAAHSQNRRRAGTCSCIENP